MKGFQPAQPEFLKPDDEPTVVEEAHASAGVTVACSRMVRPVARRPGPCQEWLLTRLTKRCRVKSFRNIWLACRSATNFALTRRLKEAGPRALCILGISLQILW